MSETLFKPKMTQLLRVLSQAHGAPGSESQVRNVCRSHLGDGFRTDRLGNLISVFQGRSPRPRVMLAAHLDEVGFVVRAIGRDGLIKFLPLGGWWAQTLPAQRVRIKTAEGPEVIGVIAAKPPHFLTQAERDKPVEIDQLVIDVGAGSAAEATERYGIRIGDPIVPESPFTPLANDDLLLGKAFDNRVGVAVLLLALEAIRGDPERYPNTILGVGTVQEEVGTRGAQTAAHGLDPDVAIVLEGTPADDHPDLKEEERQGVLDGGVQIRLMDPSAIMNRQLVDLAVRLARHHEIKHQVAVRKSGGTDARAIHVSGTGVPTLVLGVPARYIHTHNSLIHLHDAAAALALVLALAEALDQKAVEQLTAYPDR